MDFIEVTKEENDVVETLVEAARKLSPSGKIQTDYDWDFLKGLYRFWKISRPEEHAAFMANMNGYRDAYKDNTEGSAKDNGGAEIRHLTEVPYTFYMLLKGFFENETMTGDFNKRFVEEIPDFKLHLFSKL